MHRGAVIADSRAGIRTIETSHPPIYYPPPSDIPMAALRPSSRGSFCEWKGRAVYHDLVPGERVLRNVAWSYSAPTRALAALCDHPAFYAGPFKGVPGSLHW